MSTLRGPLGRLRFGKGTSAPAGVLFQMDASASAYPECGFDSAYAENANWSRSRLAAGGPTGQDAVQLAQVSNLDGTWNGGQYAWGWDVTYTPSPTWGDARYIRWRMKFTADTNFHGYAWGSEDHPVACTNKLLILANSQPAGRMIVETLNWGGAPYVWGFYFRLEEGAEPSHQIDRVLSVGAWHSIQLKIQASSAPGATDGRWASWVDNDTEGSPDGETSGYLVTPTHHDNIQFGRFQNQGLDTDGVHTFQVCDFEIASAFDSNWHGKAS